MSNIHRIRLHGPWNVGGLARIAHPVDCRSIPLIAPMVLTREFGKPTGIENENVFISIAINTGQPQILLNNEMIVTQYCDTPIMMEITHRLVARNQLKIVWQEAPLGATTLLGDIFLEIRVAQPKNE
ncbi:MAG: hypothetical protein R3B84_13210 [Zavarzinella sp.]